MTPSRAPNTHTVPPSAPLFPAEPDPDLDPDPCPTPTRPRPLPRPVSQARPLLWQLLDAVAHCHAQHVRP